MTDAEVRNALGIPSLDCHMRRKRLLYLSRLQPAQLPPLMALLQTRGDRGEVMPWMRLVSTDLAILHKALPRIFANLPPPEVDITPCLDIVNNYPTEWHENHLRVFRLK